MNRPVIGLTCNELDKENLPKQFINEAYINSVIRLVGVQLFYLSQMILIPFKHKPKC